MRSSLTTCLLLGSLISVAACKDDDKGGSPADETDNQEESMGDGDNPNPGDGDGDNPNNTGDGDGDNPAVGDGDGDGDNPAVGDGDGDGDDPAPGDGDDPAPGDGDDPAPGDGDDPAPGDGDDPAPGDGDGPPADLVVDSNLSATFVQDAEDNEGVRVTSFGYFQDSENFGAGYYTNFFLTLKNFGTSTVCQTNLTFTINDASGATRFEELAFVDSDKYQSTFLIDCLAPGAEGIAWGNALPEAPTSPSEIDEVQFDVDTSARTGLTAVAGAPTIEGLTPYDRFGTGDAAFMGTLRTHSTGIANAGIDIYVRDPGGYYRDIAYTTQLDPMAPNSSWDFTTTATDHTSVLAASDVSYVVDYSLPQSFSLVQKRAASPEELAKASAREAFRAARETRRSAGER